MTPTSNETTTRAIVPTMRMLPMTVSAVSRSNDPNPSRQTTSAATTAASSGMPTTIHAFVPIPLSDATIDAKAATIMNTPPTMVHASMASSP